MGGRSIQPATKPLSAILRAVPSKSVTHRALVAAALASGPSNIQRPLDAQDTRATLDGLARLGLSTTVDGSVWRVEGRGGRIPGHGELFLAESGTSFRFLTAVAALGRRASRLDGAPRLRERPVDDLVRALEQLGLHVEVRGRTGLPLVVGGTAGRGGAVAVPGARSSQFASALLLVGSRLPGGLELTLQPPAVSVPYVRVTAEVLRSFGVDVEQPEPLRWRVWETEYPGRDYTVEGDHSSASYFLAAAALTGGCVRMEGLDPNSSQPDARLSRLLENIGCRVRRGQDWIEVTGAGRVAAFEVEMSDAPDLVPTLAVLALFAEGPCAMRGISHLRIKESDRLELLARNLRRLGRHAEAHADALIVGPRTPLRAVEIETGSDHRMAMAFAMAGLRIAGMRIDDPACVAKSNPRFWDDFDRLQEVRAR